MAAQEEAAELCAADMIYIGSIMAEAGADGISLIQREHREMPTLWQLSMPQRHCPKISGPLHHHGYGKRVPLGNARQTQV